MKGTILIVSEDVGAGVFAVTVLRTRGWPVHWAHDGSEAYELLRRAAGAYHVMVLDLTSGVSGMNGWELLRRVRGRFEGLPIDEPPRIIVLGITHRETERFVRTLGAEVVLHKPVHGAELVAAVERLMGAAPTRGTAQPRHRAVEKASAANSAGARWPRHRVCWPPTPAAAHAFALHRRRIGR